MNLSKSFKYLSVIIPSVLICVSFANALGVFYYDSANNEFVLDDDVRILNTNSLTLNTNLIQQSVDATAFNLTGGDDINFKLDYRDTNNDLATNEDNNKNGATFNILNGSLVNIFKVDESGVISARNLNLNFGVNEGSIFGADQIQGYNDLRFFGDATGGPDLSISSSGNIGIGKTPTTNKLDISGNLNISGTNYSYLFQGTSTSGYQTVFNMDNTGLDIGHNSSGRALNLITNNTDRLTITGAGDVGIGTTSPATKLDVNGTGTFNDLAVSGEIIEGGTDYGAYGLQTGGGLYAAGNITTNGSINFAGLYPNITNSNSNGWLIISGSTSSVTGGSISLYSNATSAFSGEVTVDSSTNINLDANGGKVKIAGSLGSLYSGGSSLCIAKDTCNSRESGNTSGYGGQDSAGCVDGEVMLGYQDDGDDNAYCCTLKLIQCP